MSNNHTDDLQSKDKDFLFFYSSVWGNAPILTILIWTAGLITIVLPIIWLLCYFVMKHVTIRVEGNSLVYHGFEEIPAVQKEIAVNDIKAVEVNYSISRMIFGKKYGTLKIATAGTSGHEIVMRGVRHADYLRKLWRERKSS